MTKNGGQTMPLANDTVDLVGKALGDVAMKAAVEFWYANVRAPNAINFSEELCDAIKKHARTRLTEGLADARDALNLGMTEIAVKTLEASFALAGIDAAKEVAEKHDLWKRSE